MKVLYIGKYPPVLGGTASASFWRIIELKKLGINFDVATCIAENNEYRLPQCDNEENVYVLSEKTPWHIPYSQLYSEQLISLSLELAQKNEYDFIEGGYFFPYGFAAYIVASILNKPLILRHAGSDLSRLTVIKKFNSLFLRMINRAKKIITYQDILPFWNRYVPKEKLHISQRYVPNPNYFIDRGIHIEVAFLGKITEKWDKEQFSYYYNFLIENNYKGIINVYSNEYTVNLFKNYFEIRGFKINGVGFVHPFFVPDILGRTKYLLVSEIPQGITETSNTALEGKKMGCEIVCKDFVDNNPLSFSEYIKQELAVYDGV